MIYNMAKIHFLNVDEGDCSIIQHNNGNVLIKHMQTHIIEKLFTIKEPLRT